MKPELFIHRNIFNQLAIRGYSKSKCEQLADYAVRVWRESALPDGVKFNELLAEVLQRAGTPVATSQAQKMLLDAIVSGRCKAVYQTKRMTRMWCVEGTTEASVGFSFRLNTESIQRFITAGLLKTTESEKELIPADDVDWIPVGVKKVAA
ncbi:hypothetical protein GJQ54_05130 [Oceanospirillaceae bacterium ASx5O]|nr:hypothetical protein GJQ54_05130 [Oceanospirillaceae bacterium ASx5O]